MIEVSDNASKEIGRIRKAEALSEDQFLRIKVKPGGCSGLSYKLDFDNKRLDADKVFEKNNTKIVIDSKSYLYIAGMTLDFEGGLNGKGFTFSNPNASRTCGCGSSFGV